MLSSKFEYPEKKGHKGKRGKMRKTRNLGMKRMKSGGHHSKRNQVSRRKKNI